MNKKREVLPLLNKCIESLVAMSGDAAKLEYTNNEQASKRLKIALSDFSTDELKSFQQLVFSIRAEINKAPKRDRRPIKTQSVDFLDNE